ncbi:Smr/MutS family protein [Candidatus Peregrinibacteria bacterium]|nr:Smr/MutS family protein [Candidatus Peregrinibacteria bacterium]
MKKNLQNQRKVKNNKYVQSIDSELDLHGLTQEEAKHHVKSFLLSSKEQGLKRVLIITGKGLHSPKEAVLRNSIPTFIQTLNFSCTSAKMNQGGGGAYEVLL